MKHPAIEDDLVGDVFAWYVSNDDCQLSSLVADDPDRAKCGLLDVVAVHVAEQMCDPHVVTCVGASSPHGFDVVKTGRSRIRRADPRVDRIQTNAAPPQVALADLLDGERFAGSVGAHPLASAPVSLSPGLATHERGR